MIKRFIGLFDRKQLKSTKHSNLKSMSTSNNFPIIPTERTLDDLREFHVQSNRDYAEALNEIKSGRKTSHWIWYIFPQLALHGYSYNAKYFGLKSLSEAVLFLNDPVLGPRLVEISEVALDWLRKDKPINHLMGSSIDSLKLLASSTLFYYASEGSDHNALFKELMEKCQEALAKRDTDTEDFCESSQPPCDEEADT